MQPFEFFSSSRIVFGRGKSAGVGELAADLGHSAMVIHSGAAPTDRLLDLLKKAGVTASLWRQRGEPIVAHVDVAADEARRRHCDSVIGIGGGSAIDAAKAVAGLMTNPGSAVDYMEVVGLGKKITRPAAPWMAIPTTAGTGAEATRNAVIGLPEKKFKASIRSELLLPRIALVDVDLGVTVPPAVTASSGMDALCQLIESYTSTGASPMTDALALEGIPLAAQYLSRAFHDGDDLEAREAMALAALLSGMTLTSAGLGAVHGFAAPIGANFPIPHGTICAALLPQIVAANIRGLRADPEKGMRGLSRYATIGRKLSGTHSTSDTAAIETCVHFTLGLVRELKIPPLKQYGISPDHTAEMISLARRSSSMRFNPVILSDESLATALNSAIEGDRVV